MSQQSHFWATQKNESSVTKRYLNTHSHSSTIHNSQEVEAIQVSK